MTEVKRGYPDLHEHLEELNSKYVMQDQRRTHEAVLGKAGTATEGPGQKIELF